ncbi:tRNA guanosine(15) transglycosylase TgtA [Candidatus Thorarchaeota archaeon]|nr:MAG: tRNA guanosine(15) transglycosylase TgtA [Candidatus Thorarchaeota archaeon]
MGHSGMFMSNFEIRAKDGLARLGRFVTRHGILRTPLLMPVVHPGKSVIRPQELVDDFGFQMVITNSYIINSHERFRNKALAEGVHGLLDFDRPIMTDSGTFQMYFHDLPEEEIDPVAIIEFQKKIGTDIGTILDAFSKPDVPKSQVERDVNLSLERARQSVSMKGEMMLAGTIQGGVYEDLRERSAKDMGVLDFDVFPIGGVVPFMEMYRYADIVRVTMAVKKHLPLDRPVHLFGCGHPMFFAQAAYLGCDFFDSASYAKFAESGRMLLTSGTVHLESLSELPCDCPICSQTTAEDLKALPKGERDLALMRHNLFVSVAEMRRVRQAISDGKLFELVAVRARSHPSLLEALQTMVSQMDSVVESDPYGKSSSIFYTGPETVLRPEISRFHLRVIKRYPYKKTNTIIIVPDLGERPFSDSASTIISEVKKYTSETVILVFLTPIGVIPWELEHVHPVQQCVFSNRVDIETLTMAQKRLQEFLNEIMFENLVWFSRDSPTNNLAEKLDNELKIVVKVSASEILQELSDLETTGADWTLRKLRAVLSYQWGIDTEKLANATDLHAVFSRSTGKIRHVIRGEDILFTMVPTTGLLTPTFKGGEELLKMTIPEEYIVTMQDDVAEFVADGKSALAKFVKHASPNLRAGEEVLVVDEQHNLLGVGRALLSGLEMRAFSRGVAVAIRHSRKH